MMQFSLHLVMCEFGKIYGRGNRTKRLAMAQKAVTTNSQSSSNRKDNAHQDTASIWLLKLQIAMLLPAFIKRHSITGGSTMAGRDYGCSTGHITTPPSSSTRTDIISRPSSIQPLKLIHLGRRLSEPHANELFDAFGPFHPQQSTSQVSTGPKITGQVTGCLPVLCAPGSGPARS